MPKIIFFDIDGTLCEAGKQVTAPTVAALHRAQENGHKILIATGRNVPIIPGFLRDIGFDGIVASAGGYVIVDGQVLENRAMPPALLERALTVLDKYDMSYMLETAEGTFADRARCLAAWSRNLSDTNSEQQRLMLQLVEGLGLLPIEGFHDLPVYKICFTAGSAAELQAAVDELGDDFFTVTNMFPGGPALNGETMARGVDKGSAVRKVCEHYGMGVEDAIAFGDSANDLPMLRAAGVGVAMGNAAPDVKAEADLVCESCQEDGVARQLERMGLA
ncbi:MAG: Cof-type HAD-IIB family hydrolase [Clostridiales bacterium]|nr:Cof-type HAD-IIB family hydrolase [Clostridiales bacterium]